MELPPIAPHPGAAAASPAKAPPNPIRDAGARKAAQAFEAAFLAEMLKYTGLNAMPEGFGGGAGEEAFSSLLTDQYARAPRRARRHRPRRTGLRSPQAKDARRMIGHILTSARYARILRLLDLERKLILNGPLQRPEGAGRPPRGGGRRAARDRRPTCPRPSSSALKARAERNSRLILASLAGVRAGAEQVEQIRAARSQLRTYNAAGAPVDVRPTEITRDQRA